MKSEVPTGHDALLTEAEIEVIEQKRVESLRWHGDGPLPWKAYVLELFEADIPRLIAEVRRLQREYESLDDRFTAYCLGEDD